MYGTKNVAERKQKSPESLNYYLKGLSQPGNQDDQTPGIKHERAMKKVQSLYDGHGRGAQLAAANGTAWGLLCAVTEFVDHEKRARSQGHRLDSAWFGQGANLKQRALDYALQLVD